MDIIMHRGASLLAPENTLAAICWASKMGSQWVELDTQLSIDEELVLMHDATLNRTTNGKGLVCEKSLSELRNLDAGTWFDNAYEGEPVPTLIEAIALTDKLGMMLNLEIKPFTQAKACVSALLGVLKRVNRQQCSRLLFSSFSVDALTLLSEWYHGELNVALNLLALPDQFPALVKNELCEAIHVSSHMLDSTLVRDIHAMGKKVRVYTINSEAQARECQALGVDGIFTDDHRLVQLFNS